MVATLLPFWMQHPSRTMPQFSADPARLDIPASGSDGAEGVSPSLLLRLGSGAPVAEWCSSDSISAHEAAWQNLAGRALEPNVFLDPAFALPALSHFPQAQRPTFLLVWARNAAARPTLIGLCALSAPARHLGPEVSIAWTHAQATLSAPLLDRDRAGEALAAILDACAARAGDWGGLLLQGVATDGPLMRLVGGSRRFAIREIERRSRAVLRRAAPDAIPASSLSGKRAKELRRQARRLGGDTGCTMHTACGPEAVRIATERFLELEARGWKGGRGTALLNDPGLATFTRTMTRRLARQGHCRIESLDVGGEAVAMGIVLKSGDRSYFWKTAYDETRHRQSPGKLLAMMLGAAQLADPTVALTDSCAVPDHPMIDRLWADRMIVADLLVAGGTAPPPSTEKAARIIVLTRRCRAVAKRLRDRVRRVAGRQ